MAMAGIIALGVLYLGRRFVSGLIFGPTGPAWRMDAVAAEAASRLADGQPALFSAGAGVLLLDRVSDPRADGRGWMVRLL